MLASVSHIPICKVMLAKGRQRVNNQGGGSDQLGIEVLLQELEKGLNEMKVLVEDLLAPSNPLSVDPGEPYVKVDISERQANALDLELSGPWCPLEHVKDTDIYLR